MLVLGECGRVLAGMELLGHLPATAILGDSPNGCSLLGDLATGERRAAYLPVSPPDDLARSLERGPSTRVSRASPPRSRSWRATRRVRERQAGVRPGRARRRLLVGVALLDGKPVGVAIEADAPGVTVEAVRRYDATRSLGARLAQRRSRDRARRPAGDARRAPGISPRR